MMEPLPAGPQFFSIKTNFNGATPAAGSPRWFIRIMPRLGGSPFLILHYRFFPQHGLGRLFHAARFPNKYGKNMAIHGSIAHRPGKMIIFIRQAHLVATTVFSCI